MRRELSPEAKLSIHVPTLYDGHFGSDGKNESADASRRK